MNRLNMNKHRKDSVKVHQEIAEAGEAYKKWYDPDMEKVYFAMNTRHRTCYKKGD